MSRPSQLLISVVVPTLNSRLYIEECLNSIINQTVGPEAIEVIVVDDGSTDKTPSLVNRIMSKSGVTFKVIRHKANKGAGAARNTGIKHARGKYISFIDSDDKIDLDTYEILIKKMEETDSDIAMFAYNYFSKSGTEYPRNPSYKLFRLNSVIKQKDIHKYPELMYAISSCNKIYRKTLVDKLDGFANDQKYNEDGYFSIAGYLEAKSIYITDQATYHYRKRENESLSSLTDMATRDKQAFFDHLKLHKKLEALIATRPELQPSINWYNATAWFHYAHRLLLEPNTYMLSEKEKLSLFSDTKNIYKNLAIRPISKKLSLESKLLINIVRNTKSYGVASSVYRIIYRLLTIFRKLRRLGIRALRQIKNIIDPKYFYRAFQKIKDILICRAEYLMLNPKAQRAVNEAKKDIWIIGERGDEAKDNGYYLFRHIRKNYPDWPVYYVISNSSNKNDYARVKKLGNVLDYGSRSHKIYFLAADKILCTHARGTIEPWKLGVIRSVLNKQYAQKKYILLQHGVIPNDVSNVLGKEVPSANFDLFICGAKPEYEYIRASFGYQDSAVAYTGLARYDSLHHFKAREQILLMPTWRSYITGQPRQYADPLTKTSINNFLQSEYYRVYSALINSNRLNKLLRKNDLKLIFYPHYEFQPYLKYFKTKYANIILANEHDYEVQNLLKESRLLITDYSSVLFDFAYMRKPTILYQFDSRKYFSEHYKPGYFDYKRDGFGPVAANELDLIRKLEGYINADFTLDKKYMKRAVEFFELRDKNNCKRIIQAIESLK